MANQLQLRRGSGTPITAGFNTPLAGEPFVSTNGGGFYISTGTTGADYTFIGGTGLLSPADAGVGSRLTLKEETGGGTNFVAWQAPDAINNSYIVSMPAAVGAENEILKISGAPTTGRILGISGVTAGGSGYASGGDAVDIATIGTGTGGTGSGATARVIIKSGAVVAAYLLDPGAGYGTGTGSTLDVGGNTTATVCNALPAARVPPFPVLPTTAVQYEQRSRAVEPPSALSAREGDRRSTGCSHCTRLAWINVWLCASSRNNLLHLHVSVSV